MTRDLYHRHAAVQLLQNVLGQDQFVSDLPELLSNAEAQPTEAKCWAFACVLGIQVGPRPCQVLHVLGSLLGQCDLTAQIPSFKCI